MYCITETQPNYNYKWPLNAIVKYNVFELEKGEKHDIFVLEIIKYSYIMYAF